MSQRQKTEKNSNKDKEMAEIIGGCIEEICEQLAGNNSELSNSAELLKLVQLLEKYLALREKMAPEQEGERLEIDDRLLLAYLEKKVNQDA